MSLNKIGGRAAHRLRSGLRGGPHNMRGTQEDYANFGRDVRMFIGERDAKFFIDLLEHRSSHLSNFSCQYNIVDGELKSVFWADGVSKANFQAFGDVLAFDATYHTNKYDMIFVPFTGVDHHKRCITFGAGLIANESVESYQWLLQCFVQTYPKAPSLVLTDQDPAMLQAVESVFKNSSHRLCMWHIMKKLPAKA
ncbi:hypothetical protein QVD17_02045 [Tagetes erecta]|uniref:MULE transposase domain-containing protein n=1 Tax=Tagetes erecta TaxID=13708 RepID=A0AAD8LBP8_TARER|nr:hypothetical protein QVD17_02045 [Tagetes erecta]